MKFIIGGLIFLVLFAAFVVLFVLEFGKPCIAAHYRYYTEPENTSWIVVSSDGAMIPVTTPAHKETECVCDLYGSSRWERRKTKKK